LLAGILPLHARKQQGETLWVWSANKAVTIDPIG